MVAVVEVAVGAVPVGVVDADGRVGVAAVVHGHVHDAPAGALDHRHQALVVDHEFVVAVAVDVRQVGVHGGRGPLAGAPVGGLREVAAVLHVGAVVVFPTADGATHVVVPAGLVEVGHHRVPARLRDRAGRSAHEGGLGGVPHVAVVLAGSAAAGAVAAAVAAGDPGDEAGPVAVPGVVGAAVAVEAADRVVGAVRGVHAGRAVETRIGHRVGELPGGEPGALVVAFPDEPVVGLLVVRHGVRPLADLGGHLPVVGVHRDAEVADRPAGQPGEHGQGARAVAGVKLSGEVAVARDDAQARAGQGVDLVAVVARAVDVVVQDHRAHAVVEEVVGEVIDDARARILPRREPDPLRHPGHRGHVAVARGGHVRVDVHGPVVHRVGDEGHDVLRVGARDHARPAGAHTRGEPGVEVLGIALERVPVRGTLERTGQVEVAGHVRGLVHLQRLVEAAALLVVPAAVEDVRAREALVAVVHERAVGQVVAAGIGVETVDDRAADGRRHAHDRSRGHVVEQARRQAPDGAVAGEAELGVDRLATTVVDPRDLAAARAQLAPSRLQPDALAQVELESRGVRDQALAGGRIARLHQAQPQQIAVEIDRQQIEAGRRIGGHVDAQKRVAGPAALVQQLGGERSRGNQ